MLTEQVRHEAVILNCAKLCSFVDLVVVLHYSTTIQSNPLQVSSSEAVASPFNPSQPRQILVSVVRCAPLRSQILCTLERQNPHAFFSIMYMSCTGRRSSLLSTVYSNTLPSFSVYHLEAFPKSVQGEAQPPATSTHSARQLPSFPSTSRISVSQRHLQPTPFSFGGSGVAQYSSSSIISFSGLVVFSRNGMCGDCLAGAFAGQCWIVVCL